MGQKYAPERDGLDGGQCGTAADRIPTETGRGRVGGALVVRFVSWLAPVALGLAGCGHSTPVEVPPDVRFDVLQTAYVASEARLEARSNTAFVEPYIEGMPTSGGAVYSGYMAVDLATAGGGTVLFGEVDVIADFAAGTLRGSAGDFVGHDRTRTIDTYAGTISMTDGRIGVVRPNAFTIDYGGILTGNAEAISVSGTIDGNFKGDPIRGLLGYDTDPLAVVDGVIVGGQVGLAVETQ